MNPPTLDDIMKRERRMIQLKPAIEEEKKNQLTIKTRTGKTIPIPRLYPKPMEAGINIENGIPTKPKLDFELRRRRKKHGSRSEEI
jgi:hypothetical protein